MSSACVCHTDEYCFYCGMFLPLERKCEQQGAEIESLKWKIAHPVMCQGICTSQLDDYCGMYMHNQSCIACNSIWTEAHVENARRDQEAALNQAIRTLEWYADDKNWNLRVSISMGSAHALRELIKSDKGDRAKVALRNIKGSGSGKP